MTPDVPHPARLTAMGLHRCWAVTVEQTQCGSPAIRGTTRCGVHPRDDNAQPRHSEATGAGFVESL